MGVVAIGLALPQLPGDPRQGTPRQGTPRQFPGEPRSTCGKTAIYDINVLIQTFDPFLKTFSCHAKLHVRK